MRNKILFILHYPPPAHGAAIVGSYVMSSRIINSEFDCRFVNLGTSQKVGEIGKKSFSKLIQYLKLLRKVKSELTDFKPDLCYVTPSSHGPGLYKDTFIILLVRILAGKRIYHFHNKGICTGKVRFIDNLIYRFIFKNAFVILLSKLLYPDISRYVPEAMVRYCPNGVPDIIVGKSLNKSTHNAGNSSEPSAKTKILFLSNLIITKGVFVVLEACKVLKDNGISFHCQIAGENGDLTRSDIEKEILKLDLSSFVTVSGGLYEDEKQMAFTNTDIFIHPTFNDCLPLVLLEAMQYSLPIVSTPEGAIPDMIEDGLNGYLVPQKNAERLADKLEVLIRDPELRLRMGEAGRRKFEQEFTLERFEERMRQILLEVVNKEK